MTPINPTEFAQYTNDQVINQCFNLVGRAPLVILFVSFVILLNFFGFLLVSGSKKKFLMISLYTTITTGIIFVLLLFMPITITNFLQEIMGWFK